MKRALLASVLVVLACEQKQPPAPELTPPTAQEADAFAKQFAKAMAPCDARAVDARFDVDLMIKRAVGSRSIPSDEVRGFKRGFGSIGDVMCGNLPAGSTYTFLRMQTVAGQSRPLFRLLSDAGVNYHSLELDKDGKDRVRIADFYNYVTGETMSETVGSMLEIAVAGGRSSPMVAFAEQGGRIKQLIADKQYAEAQRVISRLPPAARKLKLVLLLEITVDSGLEDDKALLAAIDTYKATFPDDPALDLVAIDGAFIRKHFDEAIEIVDRLDKRVDDPYLDVLRANALLQAGKFPRAVATAKRATAREPTLPEGWWALLTAQSSAADFAGAVKTLDQLRTRFRADVSQRTLAADGRFGPLVGSQEFAAWLSAQP